MCFVIVANRSVDDIVEAVKAKWNKLVLISHCCMSNRCGDGLLFLAISSGFYVFAVGSLGYVVR